MFVVEQIPEADQARLGGEILVDTGQIDIMGSEDRDVGASVVLHVAPPQIDLPSNDTPVGEPPVWQGLKLFVRAEMFFERQDWGRQIQTGVGQRVEVVA